MYVNYMRPKATRIDMGRKSSIYTAKCSKNDEAKRKIKEMFNIMILLRFSCLLTTNTYAMNNF